MKISRTLLVWATLTLCAVMVLGAMLWLTKSVLAAQQERAAAEARADLEERTRLALWRMDALGAAIVLRENQHPASHYDLDRGSPFLTSTEPEVFLHFQIIQGKGLTSPELDKSNAKDTVVDEKIIMARGEHMKQLRDLLALNPLLGGEWGQLSCAAAHGETAWNSVPKDAPLAQDTNKLLRLNNDPGDNRRSSTYQYLNNTSEYAQRAKAVSKNYESGQQTYDTKEDNLSEAVTDPKTLSIAALSNSFAETIDTKPMRGVWLGSELFLLRQVDRSSPTQLPKGENQSQLSTKTVQGVWMNATELRNQLLTQISDLLPNAKLDAANSENVAQNPLALVSLPFQLVRNEAIIVAAISNTIPINSPLAVGWIAVLLALVTASLLVHGVMRLSERRASFVSAVTHELRTPLTTFRLYSDMLESGAVKPEKRSEYLRVLSREADRLSHLVENVLSFSKVERGSARSVVRESGVVELLEPLRERFEARLATAGMELKMEFRGNGRVHVDGAALEHILFNLIDNAAKYASSGNPKEVNIQVAATAKFVEITVSDYGPGIAENERRRIFRAFHKSAREAAESRPGVGLGLALSRRLAKSLGGSLDCVDSKQGAAFVLKLPLA